MTRTTIILDSAVLVLAVIAFILNLNAYRRSKRLVGRVRAEWSIRFNLSYPWEWLRWLLLLALLAIVVFALVARPAAYDAYWSLAVVCLALAFFPRNNFIVIGEAGLLDRSVFLPWTSIREKKIVEDGGRRYLELKIASGGNGTAIAETRRIRVPANVSLVLD